MFRRTIIGSATAMFSCAEASMPHLSLARIMYGTNEDLHSPDWMNSGAVSSPLRTPVPGNYPRTAVRQPFPNTFGELVHKVWVALATKH